MKEYYEISPLIAEDTAVFPGDTAFRRRILFDTAKGDSLGLSAIESTLHIGAHADAPNHYARDKRGIEQRDPRLYMGPCQVIHLNLPRGERIRPSHLAEKKIQAPRILFSTGSFPHPHRWNSDFNSLSPELVHFLADAGMKLVGIDTPSVDPESSKALESHTAIHQRDLAILEGLILHQVPEGLYSLLALPLRIKDADASPVRAILFEKGLIPEVLYA